MRRVLWIGVLLAFAAPAYSYTLLFNDFENGVSRNTSGGIWTRYPGAVEWLQEATNHNHTPGGSKSARAWEADPWVYNSYADFGATSAGLRATVYLYEDMTYVPPYLNHEEWKQGFIEVRSMFSLFSQPGTSAGAPPLGDYIELRLIPELSRDGFDPNNPPPPDHYSYGIRTKYNDDNEIGVIDTGVLRKDSDWMKLQIEVDSVADGGEVRFFIDDELVGTSQRTGTDLRYVMMGARGITYENYWYDDLSVVELDREYGDFWHGDYNGDGSTSITDYVEWRIQNEINAYGYTAWRQHYDGGIGGAGFGGAVPEPATMSAVVVAAACGLLLRRSPRRRNTGNLGAHE